METVAVKEFVDFLKSKIDFDDTEDIDNELESFLSSKNYEKASSSSSSSDNSNKKKREPTFYILFMKNIKVDKTCGKGEYMKSVANMWKNSEKGQFLSERCVELKKENNEMSNENIYNIAESEWTEMEKNKSNSKKKTVTKKIVKKVENSDSDSDSENFSELGEI